MVIFWSCCPRAAKGIHAVDQIAVETNLRRETSIAEVFYYIGPFKDRLPEKL